jgi:hypothetical protein
LGEQSNVIAEDQSAVVQFLANPALFDDDTKTVERIETHMSLVFIGRSRAFKLKRAVQYPYVDFSTAERRRHSCAEEVRINRRTAPDLYHGVIAVTREADGSLALAGKGEAVDWVVDMSRFDQETLFDRKAEKGELDRRVMEDLAEAIARFHLAAESRHDFGGREWVGRTLDLNEASYRQFSAGTLETQAVERLNRRTRDLFERHAGLLDRRRDGGLLKLCHGDLHLRNIFMGDRGPTIFDAIEFNDTFAVIDVFYDLAFLLMDLDRFDMRRLGSFVLNHYLDVTWDTEGLAVLPLFLSMRASVRAFVAATVAAGASDAAFADRQRAEARQYHGMALDYLDIPAPRLIAVGGLSGSGKSRMARELAPVVGSRPGARVIRSDVLRKRIAGVDLLTHLGPRGYTPEMTEKTYRRLYDEVRAALDTGHCVVADAVFARPEQRAAIERIARELGVPFLGIWMEAPPDVMEHRVIKRQRNVSDADAAVVRKQLHYDLGAIAWQRIDSSGPRNETLEKGLKILRA